MKFGKHRFTETLQKVPQKWKASEVIRTIIMDDGKKYEFIITINSFTKFIYIINEKHIKYKKGLIKPKDICSDVLGKSFEEIKNEYEFR